MQLRLSLWWDEKETKILVHEEQVIAKTLDMVRESLQLSPFTGDLLYSRRKKRFVNVHLTWREAFIFHGDVLEIERRGR